MTAIDPTNSLLQSLSGTAATDSTDKSKTKLGQNEFLKLMLAQLKNQDPFKPTDPTAFLGQLAQFSTVTGIENMQTSLSQLTDSMRSSQVLSGATLVGRNVLAPGSSAELTAGSAVQGAAQIPDGAIAVQVAVRDASGSLVRTFQIPPQPGLDDFSWDGLTQAGATAPTGTYKFQVLANVGGEGVSIDPMIASRVQSVTIDSNGLVLNTSSGAIPIANVHRVM